MDEVTTGVNRAMINSSNFKTAFVFDKRMTEHFCLWDPYHPEIPERLTSSFNRCQSKNLVQRCLNITPRYASEKELECIHGKEYIKSIKKTKDTTDPEALETFSSNFDSVYFNTKSFDCALLAAGCTIDLVSSVMSGQVENGFAIVRPPGHHAMPNEACGFCIFNNVALAVKYALKQFNLKRILIIDWDVHHGNGTQEIFYNDNRVLYFSIHRYEFGKFWPNLLESNFNFIGTGPGKGFNINVPLNKTGLGNDEYLSIFHNILLPVAFEFNPQLILISAGYDAAVGCVEGKMNVTPYLYAHLINELTVLAEGRICVILEGGYFIPSLAESVAVTLRALLGDPCPFIAKTNLINRFMVSSILNVITALHPIWKSLSLQKMCNNSKRTEHVVTVYSNGYASLPPGPYQTRDANPRMEETEYKKYELVVEYLKNETDLSVPKHRTCLAANKIQHFQMCDETNLLRNILERLESEDLKKNYIFLDNANDSICTKVDYKKALEKIYHILDIPLNTFNVILNSSNSLLRATDSVLSKECVNGFVVIKSSNSNAENLSIIDHLVIVAKYATTQFLNIRKSVQKVLIFNWDIHCEENMQSVYYNSNDVLMISLCHYCDNLPYDNTKVCLKAHGVIASHNVVIPWKNDIKCGDYFAILFHVILPIAYEFRPDLIFVTGFDVAFDNPYYSMEISSCFGHILKLLSSHANGKVILVMKNESNSTIISKFAYNYLKTLLGERSSYLPNNLYPSSDTIKLIQNITGIYGKYWKCLQFNKKLPILQESHLR